MRHEVEFIPQGRNGKRIAIVITTDKKEKHGILCDARAELEKRGYKSNQFFVGKMREAS